MTDTISSEIVDQLVMAVGKLDGDVKRKEKAGITEQISKIMQVGTSRVNAVLRVAVAPPYSYFDSPVNGRIRLSCKFTDKGLARWVELTERGAAPPEPPAVNRPNHFFEQRERTGNVADCAICGLSREEHDEPPASSEGDNNEGLPENRKLGWHWHGTTDHRHAYADIPHAHALRAICNRPECASYPQHDIHQGMGVSGIEPLDKLRDDGHGVILTPREEAELNGEETGGYPFNPETGEDWADTRAVQDDDYLLDAPSTQDVVDGFFAELRRLWAAEEKWKREADDELESLREAVRVGDALRNDMTNQLRIARDERDAAKSEVERLGAELNRVSQRHADRAEEVNQLRVALEKASKVQLKPEELQRLAKRLGK